MTLIGTSSRRSGQWATGLLLQGGSMLMLLWRSPRVSVAEKFIRVPCIEEIKS